MGFQQGLSGLNASSKALEAIGNNVANSGTVGFKAAAAQFSDVFAASLAGGGGSQIGIGAALSTVAQQFTQGNITSTSNPLDLAINGAGMFRLSNNGVISYTRNGQYQLDKSGFIVTPGGLHLTGYAADLNGNIVPGNLVDLQVSTTNIAPQVTTKSQIQLNLDSRATPPTALTAGTLTANLVLGGTTTITQGTNDILQLSVDGITANITIPPGSYTQATLATTIQSLINTSLGTSGAAVTVSIDTAGQLKIQSNSVGTIGSQGTGSSVILNGGNSVPTILSAATPGTLTGALAAPGLAPPAVTFPLTIVGGTNDLLDIQVDGGATVTTASLAGVYADINALATSLQNAINTALTAAAQPGQVSVGVAAGNQLQITSNTTGPTSSVGGLANTAAASLFGAAPTIVAGAAGPTSSTNGNLTGNIALPAQTITAGVNDTLNLVVDGITANIVIPAGTYTAAQLAGNLAAAPPVIGVIQTAINKALGTTGKTVAVSTNGAGDLVITSNSSAGAGSTVTLSGGTAVLGLLGAAPVASAGVGPTWAKGGDNFSTTNTLSYTSSSSQTVYDSLGNPHNLNLYFVKTSEGNRWQAYTTLDGGGQTGPIDLTFNSTGTLTTSMPLTQTYTLNNGATSPLSFSLDLTGSTQYGVVFGVNNLVQDGFTSGRLSAMSVSADGTIQGRYSNGKSRNMGQLVLVKFNNQNGLQSLGGNQWAETAESGQPIPGTPGQGSLGVVQAAAVEESN
ncbi:MAG TPA: flagellar hook-basal body complex protein, partial [Rhodocyclaceae bacterium]